MRLDEKDRREPAINAPTSLLVLIGLILAIHAWRAVALEPFGETDIAILQAFAFVPARFSDWIGLIDAGELKERLAGARDAAGMIRAQLALIFLDGESRPWTLLSYAFLHAGWEHAIFNGLWMLAFGTPVFRRFGGGRALLFLAAATAAAAVFHALLNAEEALPVIGASGGVSGLTAAAVRFVLPGGGPLDLGEAHLRPAPPLAVALADGRVLAFLAIWFGVNLLAGLGLPLAGDLDQNVAWEAHVGGFLAGLALFPLFDGRHGPAR
jgi:membrane associated rhomboid family serine protease